MLRHGAIGRRFVAFAALRVPDLPDMLEALTQRPCVAGLRETVRWHPDPAKRWAEDGLLDDVALRRGAMMLGRHGLLLELLTNPYQAEALARLAADLPGQLFVVNHCGIPVDYDPEGWRGMRLIAWQLNIVIKLFNFTGYADNRSVAAMRQVVVSCIDVFGPSRAIFGTDYPIARRVLSYRDACAAFRAAIAGRVTGGVPRQHRASLPLRFAHTVVAQHFGRCDVLVNSAGATRAGSFLAQPDKEQQDGFALKFYSCVRLCRLFWPMLKDAQGVVTNIIDGAVRTPDPEFLVGGSVSAVLPGLTETERLQKLFEQRAAATGITPDEARQNQIKKEGLCRLGQPEDVAELVLSSPIPAPGTSR